MKINLYISETDDLCTLTNSGACSVVIYNATMEDAKELATLAAKYKLCTTVQILPERE